MKFSHALVWATVALGLGVDAKLFGKDKRECSSPCTREAMRRKDGHDIEELDGAVYTQSLPEREECRIRAARMDRRKRSWRWQLDASAQILRKI